MITVLPHDEQLRQQRYIKLRIREFDEEVNSSTSKTKGQTKIEIEVDIDLSQNA